MRALLLLLIGGLMYAQVPTGPRTYSGAQDFTSATLTGIAASGAAGKTNITGAPYYASLYTATAKATTSTVTGTTVLTLNTVAGFAVGQYMWCRDMGTGGRKQQLLISGIAGLDVAFATTSAIGSATTPACYTKASSPTTGSTPTGTRVRVLNAATYSVNQGIYIQNGGTGGTIPHIATITAVNLGTGDIDYTPATIAVVASGSLVQHDDTAAFQAVFTSGASISGSANIYVPNQADGFYGIAGIRGPVQGAVTNGCNAVLCLPLATGAFPLHFNFTGGGGSQFNAGVGYPTLETDQTGATATGVALIGSPRASATVGDISIVYLDMNGISFQSYNNPDIIYINGRNMAALVWRHGTMSPGETGGVSTPTNTGSVGIIMPYLANWVRNITEDISIHYMYTGIIGGEHWNATGITLIQRCNVGVELQNTQASTLPGHPIIIDHLIAEFCVRGLWTSTSNVGVIIPLMSVESNTTDLYDDGMRGWINIDGRDGAIPTFGGSVAGKQSFVFWITGKAFIGSIFSFNSGAGAYPVVMTNSSAAAGWSGIGGYNSASTTDKYRVGYANPSATPFPSKVALTSLDATDTVIGTNGVAGIVVDGTTHATGIQVGGAASILACYMADGKTLGHCTVAVAGLGCTCSQ